MSSETEVIAEALINSGALKFGEFVLKSGVKSPYYIDLTWLFSDPESLRRVINVVAEKISSICLEEEIDKVASIELKGALLLAAASTKIDVPCIIVRKETKTYGLKGRLTGGCIKMGEKVLFFDDLITDGRSKIEGIKPIERMGGRVSKVLVVIDREQGGESNLKAAGYDFECITKITDIVNCLMEKGRLSQSEAERILNYIGLSRR